MICKVLDANNSTGISGYNVSFWKNESFNGSSMTINGGNATLNWDTSYENLGLYVWKCNITDNSTLFYNKSSYESISNIILTDSVPPRVENLSIIPNSSFEANYNSTNITVDVWDSVQRDKVWVNIKGPSYDQNFSMTNLIGNTFNLTFTPTQGGLHNVTIYANDSSNNVNYTTQNNFTVIGNTTGKALQLNQTETASGITLYNNYTFQFNVTLNNTGNGTMRFIYINLTLPTNGFYSNSTSVQCSNLSAGTNCTRVFSINVTNQADIYDNYIYTNATWQNPDYSTGFATNSTKVTVQPNPILQLNKDLIEDNVTHGTTKTVGNYTVQSIGNSPLITILTGSRIL
jgi:hypothetical protein